MNRALGLIMNEFEQRSVGATAPATFGATLKALYSHASPIMLTCLALGFLAFRIYLGNWGWVDLIAPLAILAFWPFFEWTIHKFLLHAPPKKLFGFLPLDLRVSRVHRLHHEDPTDLSDITINLEVFPTVVPVIIGLAYWLFPTVELATGALAMFFLLSLNYEFSHFVAHVRWVPPNAYYRRRQRWHRLHHYRDEKKWWGVSMGLGDVVLGTAPDVKQTERSPTVNNIHGLS